jgi:hypothetical protein
MSRLVIAVLLGEEVLASYDFIGPVPTMARVEVPIAQADTEVDLRVHAGNGGLVVVRVCSGSCTRWKIDIGQPPVHTLVISKPGRTEAVEVRVEASSGR